MKTPFIPPILQEYDRRKASDVEESLVYEFYRKTDDSGSSWNLVIALVSALVSGILWYRGQNFFAGMMTLVMFLYLHQLFAPPAKEEIHDDEEVIVCSYSGRLEVRLAMIEGRAVPKFFLVDYNKDLRQEISLSKNAWGQIPKVADDYYVFADIAVGGGEGLFVLSLALQ